jgi:predicted DNA binding CopG/RHH family protein
MAAEAFIQCRVTVETKEKVRTLAARQQLSESALLQRLIDLMLQTAGVGAQEPIDDDVKSPRDARVTIRLRGEDQALLHARAAARGMPSATYVSVLTRAHLRKLTPLPKEELLALKRTVSELGRIGRYSIRLRGPPNRGTV